LDKAGLRSQPTCLLYLNLGYFGIIAAIFAET